MRRIVPFIRDPVLRKLLPGAGSLRQARNELRWIRQELPISEVSKAVSLRRKRYPLQYILGSQPFLDLDIQCTPGVLIPRWETEEWVLHLVEELKGNETTRVLDLCTGSGCVLFGLCAKDPRISGHALDISDEAIALFEKNKRKLNLGHRCSVSHHNLFHRLPDSLRECTCVTANPPYILSLLEAERGVRLYEPKEALLEPSGIWEALVERVLETQASLAVFEVGYLSQINKCTELFAKHNWECEGKKDSKGNWRTVWARKLPLADL